jgi:hypothetical protein
MTLGKIAKVYKYSTTDETFTKWVTLCKHKSGSSSHPKMYYMAQNKLLGRLA